ncbi:hypothetical protein WME99_44960 [Sorangium sp. So ce136]|uniref:hypothetical protein n=1 Tax=Sorangium sp. So ce136 TaxID=3133284 RepID=UPI003EFEFE42
MGMCAEVIAVGSYSAGIADVLDYHRDRYATTREGAVVTRRLFGIGEGSGLSREFAALLGIMDPWDFNQHEIDPSRVDVPGLREFGRRYPDYEDDVGAFEALCAAGFKFHFRPEG